MTDSQISPKILKQTKKELKCHVAIYFAQGKHIILYSFSCLCYSIIYLYIQNVTTSQKLPFSELHCDKGRLSQGRHKPSLWGKGGRRRNWQNWEQLCRKPDVLNFLLNGKKAAHPVEARLVDFVWRLRQSLGRGLAIFQLRLGWRYTASRPTFQQIPAPTHFNLFPSHLHYQGKGHTTVCWLLSFLSLPSCIWWLFFTVPTIS